jgi:hypothetical protein
MTRIRLLPIALVCLPLAAATTPAPDEALPVNTPQEVVSTLYDLVSFGPGEPLPDWDAVRALFLPQAVIELRTTREATSIFDLEGFVNDFVTFIEKSNAGERGFTETIVRTKAMVIGDMAHILVLYEPKMGDWDPTHKTYQGVDSFQLVRKDGAWRIACVVNEVVNEDRPVPPELRD